MPDITNQNLDNPNGPQLNAPPPRPPRQGQSLMTMATDSSDMMDLSSPAMLAMQAMGNARKELLKLATFLPPLAAGIQQIIMGLEQVVPQQVADIVAGNPPGSGGSGMGAPGANMSPASPPVQTGM